MTPVPEQIAAYVAGLWCGLPSPVNWDKLADNVSRAGLGSWDPDALEEAAIVWVHEHVNPDVLERLKGRPS